MKSNVEWLQWGKSDPLYGVASWAGRERGGDNPWTNEEFYALGEDWLDFDAAWMRTVGHRRGTVLEIGSGAGRLTRKLAETFEHVIATDVSPDMLAYARGHIPAANIEWQLSDGNSIPAPDASVDAVFSCHVFQHFANPSAQLATFREVQRVLNTGGTFFVHLPMHAFPEVNRTFARLGRCAYSAFLVMTSVHAAIRRRLKMRYMHGVSYEMPKLFEGLDALGFTNVSVSAITVRASRSVHMCVSGSKP